MNSSKLRRLWMGLGILILLTPLGLILPRLFGAGGAWGEWDAEGVREIAGYLPEGLKRLSGLWPAPVPDYELAGWSKGLGTYVGYLISGVFGVVIVAAAAYILGRILKRGER